MKKVLLFLFLSLGFFTASVKAETTNTVGIINVLEINDKAKVMKSLNAQRDKAVEEIQDEVNSKRKEFEKKEEELKGKQSLMEKEAFGKEVVSFQMDVMNYDKQTEQKLSKVEKSYVEALKTIQKDYLDRIVRDIGKSKGFCNGIFKGLPAFGGKGRPEGLHPAGGGRGPLLAHRLYPGGHPPRGRNSHPLRGVFPCSPGPKPQPGEDHRLGLRGKAGGNCRPPHAGDSVSGQAGGRAGQGQAHGKDSAAVRTYAERKGNREG